MKAGSKTFAPRAGWRTDKRNGRAAPFCRLSSFSRGQATLEWLMLGLVALTLLAVAALAVGRASDAQSALAGKRILQLQADELAYYADQICVLGEGNADTVALSALPFELSYDAKAGGLVMEQGGRRAFARTVCPVQADAHGYGAQAYLRFERGAWSGRPAVRIARQP